MTWYDGGKLPPQELFQGEKLISHDGGSLIIGSKGTLFTRTWHGGENEKDMFVLLPRKQFAGYQPPSRRCRAREPSSGVARRLPRPGQDAVALRVRAVLTESLLLGNVALRTGKPSSGMRRNARDEQQRGGVFVKPEFRKGWTALRGSVHTEITEATDPHRIYREARRSGRDDSLFTFTGRRLAGGGRGLNTQITERPFSITFYRGAQDSGRN